MSETQIGSMSMPASFRYRGVLLKGCPKHDIWDPFRRKHPPMPVSQWAKIFAPFDALKGFDEAIGAKEISYTERIQPDEGQIRELDRRLTILHEYTLSSSMARKRRIVVTVEFFVPCTDPEHFATVLGRGRYEKKTGPVLRVDRTEETFTLQAEHDTIAIPFEDILSVEPEIEGLFDCTPGQDAP